MAHSDGLYAAEYAPRARAGADAARARRHPIQTCMSACKTRVARMCACTVQQAGALGLEKRGKERAGRLLVELRVPVALY